MYGKYFNHGRSVDGVGGETSGDQKALRGGARLDWQLNLRDSVTLQGDIYQSDLRENPVAVVPSDPAP